MTKPKPKLKHWDSVRDTMHDHDKYRSVSLSKGEYFGLSATVTPSNIQLFTHCGGGHGEGTWDDGGRGYADWLNLLAEAEEVRKYYFE